MSKDLCFLYTYKKHALMLEPCNVRATIGRVL